MSDSGRKGSKRRLSRRRRAQSSQNQPNHSDDQHYTKIIEDRLRASQLLPVKGQPTVAMQTRHIHNYQHAIPFRQQFVEEMGDILLDVDRQFAVGQQRHAEEKEKDKAQASRRLEVEFRKRVNETSKEVTQMRRELDAEDRDRAEQKDKDRAQTRRRLEIEYAKKVKELELLNKRGLVEQLIQDHLKKISPKGQLTRLEQLEKDFAELKDKYDQLVIVVNQNKDQCDDNKRHQDDQMEAMRKRFENYRQEIDQYRSQTTHLISQLESKIDELKRKDELLNAKQIDQGNAIEGLTLQRETLRKLSLEIEEIINTRQRDLKKLDEFLAKLDSIGISFNQIRNYFEEFKQIPSLEPDIQEIRNLFVGQNGSLAQIKSRLDQIEGNLFDHNSQLSTMDTRFDSLQSVLQQFNQTIQTFENNLRIISKDLNEKTSKIDQVNILATNALKQVEELRGIINGINDRLSSLDQIARPIADITPQVENPSDDLQNKNEQLMDLIADFEQLKNRIDQLEKTFSERTEPQPPSQEIDVKGLFDQIREIINPIFEFKEEINRVNALINDLKTQLNQFSNTQKEKPVEPVVLPKSKIVPYLESLPPIDLLNDIWI